MQRRQPVELARTEDVVGQEDVLQPRLRHHLGLAELLAGDADRAEFHLPFRQERQLVGLDVRAQLQAVRVGVVLSSPEIRLDAVEVDDDGGGVEVLDLHRAVSCPVPSGAAAPVVPQAATAGGRSRQGVP